MEEDQDHHPISLGLSKIEIGIVAIAAIIYIILRITSVESIPAVVAILGFIVALWSIMRPTEWAVEGLGMLAQRLGIGTYAAGVIGSIMANLPELILAALLILNGQKDLAILTVLIVAGANTLLFGVITIRSSRKNGGSVRVPVTTLRYETELMIVAFITSIFLFVFNFAEQIIWLSRENQARDHVSIPVIFAVGTVIIYLSYLYFLANDKELNPPLTEERKEAIEEDPGLAKRNIAKFLLFGIIGIVIAGELLANGAELLIGVAESSGAHFNEAYIALIVAGLGSIPEWAIAFKAEEDLDLVFGSVLSSISATLLFMIGLVSIFMYFFVEGGFRLDPYGMVQILLSGSILLFVNLLMKDDHKLDAFEGVCIVILQLIGFDILISI